MSVEPQSPKFHRERLTDIDHVKAVAIVLVVYGHIVARQPPAGNAWYVVSKSVLYLFHMPLFMFVSGLVLAHTFTPFECLGDYIRYIGRRASRLLPAYFGLALLVVLGKFAAGQVMRIDNAPSGISDALHVLTRPYESPASFLWYVYVLFLYCVTVPPLVQLLGRRVEALLAIGLALYCVPRTNAFGIGQYTEYFVFFTVGVVGSKRLPQLRTAADRFFPLWALAFLGSLSGIVLALVCGFEPVWNGRLWMLLLGLSAIPFFLGLVRLEKRGAHPFLDVLAKYTFTIYLFNTIFIGMAKGVLIKAVSWDGPRFLLFLPTLWLAGVLLPIVLHRLFLSRSRSLARATL